MDNNGNGAVIKNFTGKIEITKANFFRNKQDGLIIARFSGQLSANTDTLFVNNSANGLRVLQSSLFKCTINSVFSIKNKNNGLYFHHVAMKSHFSNSRLEENSQNGLIFSEAGFTSNMTDTVFSVNLYHGFSIDSSLGHVNFRNISAMTNKYNGVNMYDGKVSSVFQDSYFSRNEQDGCSISSQVGRYSFYNCVANSNSRHGINLIDGRNRNKPRHFQLFILQNSTVSENVQYGISLSPECKYWDDTSVNVTLFISENHITRNRKGGVFVSPQACSLYSNERPRRLEATVRHNHFEQNDQSSFYAYCTGRLGFNAVFFHNTFFNNTKNVITLVDNTNCGAQFRSNAVHVNLHGNSFVKNRAENIIYIDYHSFPEIRSAVLKNNTFEQNEPENVDLFPHTFRRSTTRACIVVKEGNFTLRENVFENPGFPFEISTLRHDVRQVILAEFNWWGTSMECEIINRIFDFHRRVHLSPVDFFPYFISFNKIKSVSFNNSKPHCFLNGSTIGGALDRNLTLSSAGSPYTIREDVIVLPNATLAVPANVTLQFPARSAMVVQGRLIAKGTPGGKIKFVRLLQNETFRLGGGAGPWEGRLEFLINYTWWPACTNRYRSFRTEGKIVCKQLNLDYHTISYSSVPQGVPGFVHNVFCDDDGNDIMDCSRSAWIYGQSCGGYTMHVTCSNYHWAGVHLALSQHRSLLHHTEINEAGYAYRSDINVPGAALKVDIHHHELSHIYINNSLGIGMEIIYNNLYHNASMIHMYRISNTASHGLVSMSPWLVLTNANITKTGGSAFSFTTTWGETNKLAEELTSPEIYRKFHVCSANKTFLPANKILYFTLEQLPYEVQLKCEHVMETEPGYKIVLQVLRHGFVYYYNDLNIFDGVNKSQESSIKMDALGGKDRHVFTFLKSSILFDFFKRASSKIDFCFFVYTVKGEYDTRMLLVSSIKEELKE